VPQSPQRAVGSRSYEEGWRAVNELIRADGSWSGRERNVCHRNTGGGRFEDVSFVSGLDFADDGRAWVSLDIDADGDLDLVLKGRTAPQLRLMRNALAGGNRGLIVELEGSKANRDAIGAAATLITDRGRKLRVVRSGSGFLSQSSRRLHFGISKGEQVQSLEIVWPGGDREIIEKLPAQGTVRVRQGSRGWEPISPAAKTVEPPVEFYVDRPWLAEPVAINDPALATYRGKKVLLNLQASWCPPCRAELEEFTRRAGEFSNAGLQVVLLSVEEEKPPPSGLPFPSLKADHRTIGVYSVLYRYLFDRRRDLALPLSLLIDEAGNLVKLYQGRAPVEAIVADVRAAARPALPFSGVRYTEAGRRNYNELATAMAERGFHGEARALFETALEKGRGGYEIYNNFAGLMVSVGDVVQAEKLLRLSIAENDRQAGSNANLGLLLLERGRGDEAVAFLESAIDLNPEDGRLRRALSSHYNDRGIDLMQASRPAEALTAFQKAAAADPTDAAAQMNLALYYVKSGDQEQARALLRRLLKEHPGHAPARQLLEQIPE
jgi:Flp pilus assembly protein TadD/thiol-disulfide isomerase/thioredoxin